MHADVEAVAEARQRAGSIARVLWITLALNWSVAALKVAFGLATRTMVIVADGFHSFADGSSNIIGLVAISIAGHPADKEHPYGHQKFETLAAAVIAAFLFFVSFGIFREAAAAFFHPRSPEVSAVSFAVMGVTFCVNLFVVIYERARGKALKSELLISDSWHTLSDLFVTLTVVVALAGMLFRIPYIDPLFSMGISVFIFITALQILKHSTDVFVDKAVIKPELIEEIVRSVEGVADCHEIRSRGRQDQIYVDLHVLVDDQMTVRRSHRVANLIEQKIRSQIPAVHDVIVHIEPDTHDHKELEGVVDPR